VHDAFIRGSNDPAGFRFSTRSSHQWSVAFDSGRLGNVLMTGRLHRDGKHSENDTGTIDAPFGRSRLMPLDWDEYRSSVSLREPNEAEIRDSIESHRKSIWELLTT
jgi:hypothetical protein